MKLRSVLHPSRAVTMALGVSVLGIGLASPALASTPTPQTFSQCPVNALVRVPHVGHGRVATCLVGVAGTGSFKIGNLIIDFHGPGKVQGGFDANLPGSPPTWADALDGQSFSAPKQLLPEPVLTLLGNPAGVSPPANSDVFAEASQAGPIGFQISASQGLVTTLTIPLQFHMVNSLLGSHCFIGTVADPIVLTLTTGTSGALTGTLGSLAAFDNGNILQTQNTEVVDGLYTVPGATGCGLGGEWNNDIDATNALPSPSGSNTVQLFGNFNLAAASFIKHQLHE